MNTPTSKSTDGTIIRIEETLKQEFPSVRLEFARQTFTHHVELWIYVLDLKKFEDVQRRCRELAQEKDLDQRDPEIWILAKTWTGPWPGGTSEQELRRQRDEFRRKHNLNATA